LRRTHLAHVDHIEARETMYSLMGSTLVAALSLVTALMIPDSGVGSSLPGYVYFLLTAVYWITGHWSRKAKAQPA
jgi:uncharacterized RDD family membrane protein YckC